MRLRNWLGNIVNRYNTIEFPKESSRLSGTSTSLNGDNGFQFTVHIAKGGRIVETQRFDRKRDELHRGLYVITEDQDFGHEIDKILTMESLK